MKTGAWFVLTGASAALTHMGVFTLVTRTWPTGMPELANAIGFIVAFGVSFVGHRWLTFKDASTPLLTSLLRFSGTAIAGFACNEAVFSVLVRMGGWPSWLALFVALLVAAGQTFVLGRYWAFQR